MGVSTDGQICFGIKLTEDQVFPWDDKYEDFDNWYYHEVLEYKPPFEIFDDEGEYVGNVTEEKKNQYFEHWWKFTKANKLPVTLVNVCSNDYPLYILSIPESELVARRGYPQVIDPNKFQWNSKWEDILLSFCETHGLETEDVCNWYLSSYWG